MCVSARAHVCMRMYVYHLYYSSIVSSYVLLSVSSMLVTLFVYCSYGYKQILLVARPNCSVFIVTNTWNFFCLNQSTLRNVC